MKAILKFDLEEPEDRELILMCLKSSNMDGALDDIKEVLRRELKYGDHSGKAGDLLNKLNDEIWEIMEDI